MAEEQTGGQRMAIRLDYRFDRLLSEKLAQAYELLVPERRGFAGGANIHCQEVLTDENQEYDTIRINVLVNT